MSERHASGVIRIARAEYEPHAALRHLFLVGSLARPVPHPFIRDTRLEVVLCYYEVGDHGRYHWHRAVTEFEVVLEGRVGCVEAATGKTVWFEPGDLSSTPQGLCVRRLIPVRTRTLAVKVPSLDDKVHCDQCDRECPARVAPRRLG